MLIRLVRYPEGNSLEIKVPKEKAVSLREPSVQQTCIHRFSLSLPIKKKNIKLFIPKKKTFNS